MSELTDSCPKDKYKFKLRITNNTNTIFFTSLRSWTVMAAWRVFIYIAEKELDHILTNDRSFFKSIVFLGVQNLQQTQIIG